MSTKVSKTKTPKHTQKYEPESETEPISEIVKFQTLKLGQEYVVSNFTEPRKSEFGMYCVLEVSEDGSEELFEMFSTPLLMKYIENEQPKGDFSFTVKQNKGKKYPFIEGYSQERKWVLQK